MKKNVGTIDALIRISFGLFGLAWGISKMVSNPRRKLPPFIAFISAMKAAEGITRFCPGLAAVGLNTLQSSSQPHKEKQVPQAATHKEEHWGTLLD